MGFLFGHGGAYKKAENNWDQWKAENEAYYKNLAGQYATGQDSASQYALAAEKQILKDNLATQNATAAITGASPAAQALAKQQTMETVANTQAQQSANATSNAQNAMGSYLSAAKAATEGKNNALIQEAQAQSQALSGLIQSGASLAGSFVGK